MAMQVKFPFGRLVSVLVTHVDPSSGNFFVQINDEAAKLDNLMAEIEQNVLSGRAKPPKASEIAVGCIYIVQYVEDSRWYRARVLGANMADQSCEVFFLDYGNTEIVPLTCVRNAEDRFCELPPQSFECELEGLDHLQGDSSAILNDTILEQELFCKALHLKKNCAIVSQLFFDEKGTRSVLDELQSGSHGVATYSLSNSHTPLAPRPLNVPKKEVKYRSISLPVDSYHDLSVTWVVDPSHFWCQLLSNLEVLEALMENLAEVYANLDPSVLPLQSCTVGSPCCAKFYEDDAWYRAVITNVSSIATGRIEVRFVDYGNAQHTELSDIRDLKEEFFKHPCQAINFAISGVEPASKDGQWAQEAKTLFDKLIKSKHVVGLITSIENDGRHRVKLMDTTSDLDMELNQILIAANYGVRSPDPPKHSAAVVPTATYRSDSAVKPVPHPAFVKENIQIGKEEKVLVTNITSPSTFFCQLFRNGPLLEKLMMEVKHHYSRLGANEQLLSSPSPGDPCCAQFSEDGCWYRAVVLNTSPKGVSVLYIDYGNSETVPANRIKKLIPKFSELPQQGIECTLNRIKPKLLGNKPQWRSQDTKKFMDLALEMEAMMTVIARDSSGVCRVELVVKNRQEEQNISEQLLISGNAELADGAMPASANFSNLRSQTLPEPDFEVGQFEDVLVSFIEHPCNFWCQLQKSTFKLESLMQEIAEQYATPGHKSAISNPSCGMLCCAQFTEDDRWYRGKITGIIKGGKVEVHFVDYGNCEQLPLLRVRKLETKFLVLPPQAVKCALTKIDPSVPSLTSDEVMYRFEELTLEKELVMMADKYDKNSSVYEVVLLDTSEGKNLDIAKEIQMLVADSKKQELPKIPGIELHSGTTERVFVSSASGPSKFSCQLMKMADSLDELMNEMFEYYDALSGQQEQLLTPSVDKFCAAKFTLDDGWYRARILEVQGDNVSVIYIDYGNSETLLPSRLKVLASNFHNLPTQAINCSLCGNFSAVSDAEFQGLVLEKEFMANVVSVKNGVAVMDLVSKETNQSISNTLNKKTSTAGPCSFASLQWQIGDTIDVFVIFIESAQKFFCQASSHLTELDDLMNQLEENCRDNSESPATVSVGCCCAALCSDGGWYRARVERVQGSEVRVHYVDYGDSAAVPLSSIRSIKPEFCKLPAQAVQCCTSGFSASQGTESFKDLAFEKEFKVKVLSVRSDGIYEVELLNQGGLAKISGVSSGPVVSEVFVRVSSIQWKLGDTVDVVVPFAESANSFFCHVCQNANELDNLMASLEEHCSANQDALSPATVGTFCVAKYEDGGWYRGQISEVQGESVKVFYIDYGDTAVLPVNCTRRLEPEFATLPAQAVKCCLRGCSLTDDFKDLVTEHEFQAHVIGVRGDNCYEVELVSADGSVVLKSSSEGVELSSKQSCSVTSIQWNVSDKVEVFVSFVERAQKFFCQPVQTSSDLDDVMANLEEHYSTDKETVSSISNGAYCVAQYEDGGWYRAQVTQLDGESVNVFYIDYGDTSTLPLKKIRTLRPEFAALPAQAVQCCLKGFSHGGEPENFKHLVMDQEFDLQVLSSKHRGAYEVELRAKDGSKLFAGAVTQEIEKGLIEEPLVQLTAGSYVQLCPTSCVSPHMFHCQINMADHKQKLQQLMDQLQDHYENLGEKEQALVNPTAGLNCAAVFADDNLWYRARITKVTDQQFVELCFIDFGNCERVPLGKVKTISPDLLQLPPQAIYCSLPSIIPVSGGKVWPDDALERFMDLTMNKKLLGKVIQKGTDGSLEVDLFDTNDSSVDVNIGELLIREGLAKRTSRPAEPSAELKPFSLLSKPQPAENEKVYITAIESPLCFYCQISGSEDKLAALMSGMSAMYDSISDHNLAVTSASMGDVCCAQFSVDNQWYRAVIEGKSADNLTVRFIDYGNMEILPIRRIKVLADAFFKEPPLALKCTLSGTQSLASQALLDEAAVLFEELTLEKELDAKFVGFTDPFEIQLSYNGMDLCGELLKAGPSAAKLVAPSKSDVDDYTMPDIACGEMYNVCITHISSPGKFFCQLENLRDQLDGMMNDLNNHYFQLSESEGCLNSPAVGQPCVALYEDMWYRARVTSVSGNELIVHYVDYGNAETVQTSTVKQMKPLFLKVPQVAIECSVELNRDEWSEEATTLLEELTGENQLIIQVLSQQANRYQVKVSDGDAICISQEVLNVISGTVPLVKQEKPTLKQLFLHAGQKEEVYVSHIESSLEFYVQLSSTYMELTQMMAHISEVYSSMADDVRPEDLLPGTPICAIFPEDGSWYRAVVESFPSEFEAKVQFVDYGNSSVVLLSDVRLLSRQFYDLPVQAVRCCLPMIENTEIFQERVHSKELKATFLSKKNDIWEIALLQGEDEGLPKNVPDTLEISAYLEPVVISEMKCSVYVSHVVSPEEFYVQLCSSLDELSSLSGQMSQFFSQTPPSGNTLKEPLPGMPCCAKFSQDGEWYRGKVKDISPMEGAYVQFVDYGNGESVPFSEIKDPLKSFMELPQQAICCFLDVTKDSWSSQELNIFQTAALDKSFDATFIVCDGEKWRVRLESNGVSLMDLFVTKDIAHAQQGEKGVSGMQAKKYLEQALSVGQMEEVFVSHVTDCGEFYIQLSRASEDLQTIDILVSEFYDQLGPSDEALEICSVDSLCCGKCSQDFKWYRALVTRVISETEVEVLFVDYGNTDSQKVEGVKQIKPELLQYPVQAIKCRVEGSKEIWSKSDIEQFEASFIDEPLLVTFTRQEGDTWFVISQELDLLTSKGHPKMKSFSKERFDCDKNERAYFVYADSPDCVWLQPERSGDALVELMDQIANDVSGRQMDKSQLLASVPCLGQFTDNDVWHRAEILGCQGSTNATVFYVDYGNSEILPLDRLRPISDVHLKLPAQAVQCRLADVQGVDPSKVTSYLNEFLFEKVVEVEVQEQHADGTYTVRLYDEDAEQSVGEHVVCECLGDTSLLEETSFQQTSPVREPITREKRGFKLPHLNIGRKVPVSFISAFLPGEMQLFMTERVEERDNLCNSMTALYEALDANDIKFLNPEVGDLCCVHISPEQDENKKWVRGEILSISSDETATVKLVDFGVYEKIPISQLRDLQDEFVTVPVFVLESSLANIYPSSTDGQWSPECTSVLDSMCRSKTLIAEVTQTTGTIVELILHSDSGTSINQSLVDLGYARASDMQDDFSAERLKLRWPEFQIGEQREVYLSGAKDLKTLQLQLADSEEDLKRMREHLTSIYCALGEADDILGNPRVGQTCCAQFADDKEWYRAVVTFVSEQRIGVKFVDYGNMDLALSLKQLREEFYELPVQCFECSLSEVIPAADVTETELGPVLLKLYGDKKLTAEVVNILGDSVLVNLFDKVESVAEVLVTLGHAVYRPSSQVEVRRVSISEEGKIVYNYPERESVCTVSITAVNSPSDFWCKMKDSTTEIALLSEKTDQFYQDLGENDLKLFCLQAGDMCCAKFSDDNKWYRSLVSKVDSGAQVWVRSVDYPKQEALTLDKIKKLEAKFAKLPVQYFNCSLADIEPPHRYYGEDWSSKAVGRFKELCENEDVKIIVKSADGDVVFVQLLDSTGWSIADKLVADELAVEMKSPLTETCTEGPQIPVVGSEEDQVDAVMEQSSEEDIFVEAESGIEGDDVSEKGEVLKDKEEDEHFHDSFEQVAAEEKDCLVNPEGLSGKCVVEMPGSVHIEGETEVIERVFQSDDEEKEGIGKVEIERMRTDSRKHNEVVTEMVDVAAEFKERSVPSDEARENEAGGVVCSETAVKEKEGTESKPEIAEERQEGETFTGERLEEEERFVASEEIKMATVGEKAQELAVTDVVVAVAILGEKDENRDAIVVNSCETVEEGLENLAMKTADEAEEKDEGVEHTAEDSEMAVESQEGEGQQDSREEELPLPAAISDEKEQTAAKETKVFDNSEPGRQELEEDAGERDVEFAGCHEVVTQAFSEEDLTGITGNAEDEAVTVGINKSDEERNGLEETQMQVCMEEESAKVFLEEILLNVCRDVEDAAQAEYKEPLDAVQVGTDDAVFTEDASTDPSEQENHNGAGQCNELLGEARKQFSKEVEEVNKDKTQVETTNPSDEISNGMAEQETLEMEPDAEEK